MQKTLDNQYLAAIYLRLSKEDDDRVKEGGKTESNSIANQRSLIKEFLKKHPEITFVREFCDDGFTGTDFNRPAFNDMMESIKRGEINCIIVKDFSRFGREYIESGNYLQKIFPRLGIRFIAITDNYDSANKDQAGNDIVVPIKNFINDSYSRDISVKVRSNLEIKRKNGEFVGSHVVYGYQRSEEDKHKLEIDKRAAAVIQRIFQMKVDGSSPEQIAKRLNEEGVLSPLEYKRYCDIKLETSFKQQVKSEWSHVTVYRILQNEMYTGTLVQGKSYSVNYKVKTRKLKDKKEWTRTENAHEAIIPPGPFDLVQKLLREDTRSTMGDEKVALFSGKIFCAECHNTMARKRSVISGKEYIYYVCKDSNCKLRVKEQPVYDAVSAVIQSQVAMALDMERALKQLDDVSWERRELERIASGISRQEEVIAHNNQLKSALYEDFKSEMISLEEYRIFKAEFDKNISEAKGAIAHLIANRNQVKNGLTDQQSWLSQFHQYRNIQELTRRVVVYFIDKIEITTEKEVLVTLNYADQFKSIEEFLDDYHITPKEVG